ncbi:tRNA (guanosine(46)-N7)-methyltransferase TrmB [Mechercharimyces sp. CAU 1602]|uniref:tRNA (guanosine(46)-N7)-methyltransferase TrmB n=1 Tax=Mechercharimyces sp. CAU 1602 TaxID=2973933 RepID=UPI00216184C3|nr:tRNA (guanosine(46)-N7)-methyltransferase TrmB [Mechercharimyces sp. CAU 1602]MCS1350119.1 tRNA (guanosine(46)-N7)-methyltransferase TrmB [Mechercharimyces sp. CAU 1602]
MRLRRNPKAKEILNEHPLVINEPQIYKGKWSSSLFPQNAPLHVELGTGKGQFLAQASQTHPHINWLGIERIEEPLVQAIKKATEGEETPTNLHFIWMDINHLNDVFAEQEVAQFYLHFSDPWPKSRHARRRLSHRHFLEVYARLLHPTGRLSLKTDNRDLYFFTLEELEVSGYHIVEKYEDLHHSSAANDNITTEYEEKFSSQGMPIYRVIAAPPSHTESLTSP